MCVGTKKLVPVIRATANSHRNKIPYVFLSALIFQKRTHTKHRKTAHQCSATFFGVLLHGVYFQTQNEASEGHHWCVKTVGRLFSHLVCLGCSSIHFIVWIAQLRRGHAILKTKLSPVSEGVVWEVRKKEGEEMIYGEAGLRLGTGKVNPWGTYPSTHRFARPSTWEVKLMEVRARSNRTKNPLKLEKSPHFHLLEYGISLSCLHLVWVVLHGGGHGYVGAGGVTSFDFWSWLWQSLVLKGRSAVVSFMRYTVEPCISCRYLHNYLRWFGTCSVLINAIHPLRTLFAIWESCSIQEPEMTCKTAAPPSTVEEMIAKAGAHWHSQGLPSRLA